MAKLKFFTLKGFVALSMLLVNIAVGMAIVNGILTVPFIGITANTVVGWAVVVGGALNLAKEFGLKM